jgi:hypothetical protein
VADARYVVGAQVGAGNLFVGTNAGGKNTTGSHNNFLGYLSGTANTAGFANNFLGFQSGAANTTGWDNNFLGYQSGAANTTGTHNNFLGYLSGTANTTGFANNFLGFQSGAANTTGYYNNFLGYQSGAANTTGYYNNFLGYQSGAANTTGFANNFLGYRSGSKSTPIPGAQGITGATTWSGPWVVGNVYDFDESTSINGAVIDGSNYNNRYFTATTTSHVLGAQAGMSVSVATMDAPNNLTKTTAIGYLATATGNNSTAIGANSLTTKANQVVLGDGTVVEVKTDGIYVGKIGGVSQRMVGLQELKTLVAAAADFNAFKTAIAALT